MSVFSYHLVKTSIFNSLKALMFPLKPGSIPGLVHAECMMAMTLGSPVFSFERILPGQLVLFAQWKNESDIDNFLSGPGLGKIMSQGWHTRLNFLRQCGTVSGFQISNDASREDDPGTPVVAVTLARMKMPEVPRFIHWGRPVEKLVRDHPGTTLSLASIRLPRTVSTFSIWRSQKEMTDMVNGHSPVPRPQRHRDAMRERERKDFHFEFTTLRFKPISEYGEWNGQSNFTTPANNILK